MARWVERNDHYTEGHLRRVSGYGQQVAQAMGFSREAQMDVRYAGILHDIGRSGPPKRFSHAPDRSPPTRSTVATHPVHGESIIAPMRCAARVGPIVRGITSAGTATGIRTS